MCFIWVTNEVLRPKTNGFKIETNSVTDIFKSNKTVSELEG